MLDQSWLETGSDNEDQEKLFLRLKNATSCSENQLQALLKSSPWHRWQPQLEGIKQAVARLNALQAAHEVPAPIDRFCIAARRDAQLKIQIDKDKMTAYATVVADWGGEPLTLERLQEAMAAAGVTVGQSPDLERQAVAVMHHAPAGSEQVLPIARGTPAKNGLDCRFEPLVETLAERVLKPRELDHGRVDLRDLGTFTTVQAGTPLLRRHPATEGEAGVNVQGQPLPPKPGKDAPLSAGEGSEISASNPNLLVAQRAGMPRHDKNTMVVDNLLTIKSVDAKHGHVDFNGSLIITGDVEPGMKVTASGDVAIGGFVESAQVQAGGHLAIKHGAIGHRTTDHKAFTCRLSAQGNLTVAFAQYASLESDQDLLIQNQVSHCYCRAGKSLIVGDASGRKGTLLGGLAIANESIQAPVIGALAANHTRLQVLGGYFALHSQEQELTQEKSETQAMLGKLQALLIKLVKLPQEKRDRALLLRLKEQREHHMARLKEVNGALEELHDELAAVLGTIHVTATVRLYPGVEVELADLTYRAQSEHGPCRIHIQEGKAQLQPWNMPAKATH